LKVSKSIINDREQRRLRGRDPRVTLGKKKRMEGPRCYSSNSNCRRNEIGRRRIGG